MSFLFSSAGWFLAGIPVIVLLYLLKQKRRTGSVSTLLFWSQILEESRSRALWHRLRSWLSLLLQLLIFLLLTAALAKPILGVWKRSHGNGSVVVIDDRLRAGALAKEGRPAWNEIQANALSIVRNASPQNPVALIGIAAGPRILSPFSGDATELVGKLKALQPTDATGDAASAEKLAAGLLRARASTAAPILLLANPGSRSNVAISRFGVKRIPSSPDTAQLLIEVHNYGTGTCAGTIDLSLDGKALDAISFNLEPGGSISRSLDELPARRSQVGNGLLQAHLELDDALRRDNDAYAILPRQDPIRVLLISSGNPFLERALQANSNVQLDILLPENATPELAKGSDVLILDDFIPAWLTPEFRANCLYIAATPYTSGSNLKSPVITDESSGDPLLRGISLRNLTILDADLLTLPGSLLPATNVVTKSGDNPLLVRIEDSGHRTILLPWKLQSSDLPLRVAFPLLLQNCLQWLSNRTLAPTNQALVGEPVALRSGESVTQQGKQVPRTASSFTPMQAGFYQVTSSAGDRWVAANTFCPEESALAASSDGRRTADTTGTVFRAPILESSPWRILALAVIVLSGLEWWLFHTRRTE